MYREQVGFACEFEVGNQGRWEGYGVTDMLMLIVRRASCRDGVGNGLYAGVVAGMRGTIWGVQRKR